MRRMGDRQRVRHWLGLPVAGIVALFVLVSPVPVSAKTTRAVAASFSPNPGTSTNQLYGVSARSSTAAWAVGTYAGASNVNQSLVLHWNATKWSKQATPDPGPNGNQLTSVRAFSSSNVWAVGSYSDASFTSHSLALHWNGAAWSQRTLPVPSSSSSALSDVAGTSASNIWVSGWYGCGSLTCTFYLHWNGTLWSVVPTPRNGSSNISVLGATSAWSAGTYYDNVSNTYRTIAYHWNGTAWKLTSTPDPEPSGENWFYAVNGDAANDVWATGWTCAIVSGTCGFDVNHNAFVAHWTGKSWSQTPSGVSSTMPSALPGVTSISTADAWAVGSICPTSTCSTVDSLALNWNGTSWSTVAIPSPGTVTNSLQAVDGTATGNVFAVGYYSSGNGVTKTLALHWDGTGWSQT